MEEENIKSHTGRYSHILRTVEAYHELERFKSLDTQSLIILYESSGYTLSDKSRKSIEDAHIDGRSLTILSKVDLIVSGIPLGTVSRLLSLIPVVVNKGFSPLCF